MITIALIFHKIGHYLFLWIRREKLQAMRERLDWIRFLFEMNGVIMNFLIAFIAIVAVTLTSKEEYLPNDNAVFGMTVSKNAQKLGFQDGDRVLSVNGKKVDLFDHILRTIIAEPGSTSVLVLRHNQQVTISISDDDKLTLLPNNFTYPFLPKLRPDSATDFSKDYLKYEVRNKGFHDAIISYTITFKAIITPWLPKKSHSSLGGFITIGSITNDLIGYVFLFAVSSILLGLINLIPLPGLDAGNTIIALIEKIRKKQFNSKRIRVVRIVCSGLITALLIALAYLN